MMTNDELLETPEYWTTRIQLDLYSHLQDYMRVNGLNRTQLAQKLGVTKGYITQVLNGDFDHRLSKLVELSLAVGLIPQLEFVPKADFFEEKTKVVSGFQPIAAVEGRGINLKFGNVYRQQQQLRLFCNETDNTNDKFRFAS